MDDHYISGKRKAYAFSFLERGLRKPCTLWASPLMLPLLTFQSWKLEWCPCSSALGIWLTCFHSCPDPPTRDWRYVHYKPPKDLPKAQFHDAGNSFNGWHFLLKVPILLTLAWKTYCSSMAWDHPVSLFFLPAFAVSSSMILFVLFFLPVISTFFGKLVPIFPGSV